jgi:SAM-dependent methyltransferase
MKKIISRLKKDPVGLIKRGLYKLIVGPLRYGKGQDYSADKYWQDRFTKYGLSFKGAGHEGLSEEENKKVYKQAQDIFIDLCKKESLHFNNISVLEIGCGSGFYTKFLLDLGVRDYTGVDITDVLFPELKKKFPEFKFVKKDITKDKIEGKFDLIVMIDVIQHIVNEDNLSSALENVRGSLEDDGIFIISPVNKKSKKHLFYVHWWSEEDIRSEFSEYAFIKSTPLDNNGSYMLVIKHSGFKKERKLR